MRDDILGSIVTILVAVVGVATLAVILSKNSNTANVVTSGGNAFAKILGAATGPVTGSGFSSYSPTL